MRYVAAQRRLRALNADGAVPTRSAMVSGPVRRSRGAYESARRDVREFKLWDPTLGSAATDTLPDLPTLRARAYDADRNQPLAAGITETNLDHVIGTGLYPVPTPDRELLDITEDQARTFVRQVRRLWRMVNDTTRLHYSDRLTGLQMQWGMLRSAIAGGDTFAVRRFRERPGDLLGLKLQWLEAPRVSIPMVDGIASGCKTASCSTRSAATPISGLGRSIPASACSMLRRRGNSCRCTGPTQATDRSCTSSNSGASISPWRAAACDGAAQSAPVGRRDRE